MDNVFGLLTMVGSGLRLSKMVSESEVTGFNLPMATQSSEAIIVFVNGLYQNVDTYAVLGSFLNPVQRPWEAGDRVDIVWLQNSEVQGPRTVRNLKGTGLAAAGQVDVEVPFVYTLGGTLEVYVNGLLFPPGAYTEKDVTHITLATPFTELTRLDFRFYY